MTFVRFATRCSAGYGMEGLLPEENGNLQWKDVAS